MPVQIGGATYRGVVTDGWGTKRGNGIHRGADIMYRRLTRTDRPEYAPGSTAGTPLFFAPQHSLILSARDGTVWSVKVTPRGVAIIIDHGKPWSTFYTHLEYATVTPGQVVRAGDVIGGMGFDPLDKQRLRHLHFEAHYGGSFESAVDVAAVMEQWKHDQRTWKP